MQPATIKKWKRDALEIMYDYHNGQGPKAKKLKQQTDRVLMLIEALEAKPAVSQKPA